MTTRSPKFFQGQELTSILLNKVSDSANEANEKPVGSAGGSPGFAGWNVLFLETKDIGGAGAQTEIICTLPLQSVLNPSAREYRVRLPVIFTETSRNFGGTIGNVTYVYTDINTRTATGTAGSETQYLTPPFVLQEGIYAVDILGRFFLLNDGRMWAIDPPPP